MREADAGRRASHRRRRWIVAVALAVAGCAPRPPPVVISYDGTPAPVRTQREVSPTSSGERRPTRLATDTRSFRMTPDPEHPSAAPPAPLDAVVHPTPGPAEEHRPGDPLEVEDAADPTVTPPVRAAQTSPPSATPAGVLTYPGQVSEADGAFVTSSSVSSRYYYARADTGWHRIRADRRIWFATVDALQKVFPRRMLHGAVTPTPLEQPSGSPSPVH